MSCAIILRAPPCGVFGLPTVCSDSDFADVGIHGAVDTTAHLAWLPHPDTSVMGYNDLGFRPGDYVCFRLSAYNADGLSEPTSGVCTTI